MFRLFVLTKINNSYKMFSRENIGITPYSMGKIIGICNQKGGTGKTTTSVNLSAYLGLANKKTLLVDMDPQGNATSGLGIESNSSADHSIYESLIANVPAMTNVISSPWPNLSVIPSHISLTGAEIELVNMPGRERRLQSALQPLKEQFSYIVIDAPPSLGLLTVNVLCAADTVIIPIQCEYYALEGMSKLLRTIELIRESINPSLTIEGILLTMADFRTRLTLQVIDEVKKFFATKTFNAIIPRNIKLAEAPSFGKPIYFYDTLCVGSKAYLNLAEELLKEKVNVLVALGQGGQ